MFIDCTWRRPGVLRVRRVPKKYEQVIPGDGSVRLCVTRLLGFIAGLESKIIQVRREGAQKWNWEEKNLGRMPWASQASPKHPISLGRLSWQNTHWPNGAQNLGSQRNSVWAVASKPWGGLDSSCFVWHGCIKITTAFQNTILCWQSGRGADRCRIASLPTSYSILLYNYIHVYTWYMYIIVYYYVHMTSYDITHD